jgi:flavin-dependent dehydrogenase
MTCRIARFAGRCEKIQADFIIGADGVNSRVSKLIDGSRHRKRTLAFGLECEIPRELLKRSVQSPEIYLGIARWGYGWVFPKKNSVTVGLAGLLHSNSGLQSNFEQFLRQICGFLPGIPYEGHHIPFGHYLNMPGRAATLLVGDAAGLVEPVTGEGIAFAMLSGMLAVIVAAQGNPNAALIYLVDIENCLCRSRPNDALSSFSRNIQKLLVLVA